jgi:predicted DNA-binding transcriptional regulator YafY
VLARGVAEGCTRTTTPGGQGDKGQIRIWRVSRDRSPLQMRWCVPLNRRQVFEAVTTAIAERCAITIIYERGLQRSKRRKITPRLMLEVNGIAYVVAHCHLDGFDKTFRLDRILECWLA